jgi:uncharacterized membrane protein YhaH (DUF805 family)
VWHSGGAGDVDFGDAIRAGFRNWNTTSGRATRSEFWWWILFYFLGLLAAGLVAGAVGSSAGGLIAVVVVFGLLVPSFTVAVRRLHDSDRSGWYLLLNLIPYVGALILLYFYVVDGSPGPNRFGPRAGGNLPTYRPDVPIIGVADELKKLDELRAAGTITDEEFQKMRARLLPG